MKYTFIHRTLLLSLTLAATFSVPTYGEETFSLDSIIAQHYRGYGIGDMHFLNDGRHYVSISYDAHCLLQYDLKTGQVTDTLIDVTQAHPAKMKAIEGFRYSPKENRLLLWEGSKPVYRRSFTAQYYVYNPAIDRLEALSEKGDQRDAHFSPDGYMVAFARDNNLFIKKLDFRTEVQVTTDGLENQVINGTSDWAYEEEFYVTRLFEWSADSRYLFFVRSDESRVKEFSLPVYACAQEGCEDNYYYPGTMTFKYPKAGGENSRVSLKVYHVQYRQLSDINLPLEEDDYLPCLIPTRQPAQVAVARLNRRQDHLQLYYANAKTRSGQLLLNERHEGYVETHKLPAIEFTSKDFTFVSERDGYRHLYLFKANGTLIKQLTSGTNELTDYYGRDTLKNEFYYQLVDEMPYRRAVYKTDAKGRQVRLSDTQPGWHTARFSPDFATWVETYSRADYPEEYTLRDAKGRTLRVLQDNAELRARLDSLDLPKKEITTFQAADGQTLYAWVLKPAGFSPEGRYPVLMVQYSGPGSQRVYDRYSFDWEYFLSTQGYMVVCTDVRGTDARGADFRRQTYMNLGQKEVEDQVAVARQLGELPYVDAARIGIWGWSYGGYMSLLCLSDPQGLFKAGIAIAPVTDWRFYGTVYTERYMRQPKENPYGYDQGSPMQRVNDIKGSLLLVHGLLDDNVHPNQSMELVDALVRRGFQFDMQVYPNRNHSILGTPYRQHLYQRCWRFLQSNL